MADGTGESQHSALRLGLMQSFRRVTGGIRTGRTALYRPRPGRSARVAGYLAAAVGRQDLHGVRDVGYG
jgi:hypothetical protein